MRVPDFNDPELSRFLVEQDREIERFKKNALSGVTANRSVLLYSPSKFVYELTVSDAGVLQIVKVSG
jgi:hypothetical protein